MLIRDGGGAGPVAPKPAAPAQCTTGHAVAREAPPKSGWGGFVDRIKNAVHNIQERIQTAEQGMEKKLDVAGDRQRTGKDFLHGKPRPVGGACPATPPADAKPADLPVGQPQSTQPHVVINDGVYRPGQDQVEILEIRDTKPKTGVPQTSRDTMFV